ncbi:helix-turn-helix domain-containing protein [Pseudenhygromyxa sp. WMMC2535]|uniref:helix-turn-helix domain-containing protein n=1 Tax=Pseudenhygromyxa sp. WMMC2535 TaxID=2712867 RepID=UPI001552DF56|nr:helix-turn-helix domain-containing protein [Pseudenhygromyxa sp. WMMC2535]NVB36953.1 helix-turn-helix domain-containing protein [Pseudenhygromyxa sp. WMMC2535]
MDDAHEETASNLGHNVRQLREARGLSQAQVAKLAGVPRPTWTNIESGSANPTLAVLLKVAAALHVRVEELLATPRGTGRFYPASSLEVHKRGAVTIRKLLPEGLRGLDIERFEIPAGASLVGVPHTQGTREYLTCERGGIELSVRGRSFRLEAGDVVVFAGDQHHAYRNVGRGRAVAHSVVTFASPGARAPG